MPPLPGAAQAGAAGRAAAGLPRPGQRHRLPGQLPGGAGGVLGHVQVQHMCVVAMQNNPFASRPHPNHGALLPPRPAAPRGRLWRRAVPAGAPGTHLCRGGGAGDAGRGGGAVRWGCDRAAGSAGSPWGPAGPVAGALRQWHAGSPTSVSHACNKAPHTQLPTQTAPRCSRRPTQAARLPPAHVCAAGARRRHDDARGWAGRGRGAVGVCGSADKSSRDSSGTKYADVAQAAQQQGSACACGP